MMSTSGLILVITKRTTHLESGLKLTRRCQESLKTTFVDNKLNRLLLYVQNHIQSRCMKMERKRKSVKEITKTITKNAISHEDYKNTLLTGKEQMRTMKIIQSDQHEVYSVEVNKVRLSSKYDKRHVLPNKTDTLALGHYRLRR